MKKYVKKLVVPAAGRGTRLLPITSVLPKEILPIIDKPMIQYVLEESLERGIEELILVINPKKKLLLTYLENTSSQEIKTLLKKIKMTVVYQEENGKYGDAVPIIAAAEHLSEPFLVSWADSFSLKKDGRIKKLLDTYAIYQKPVISLIPISKSGTIIYAVPKIKKVKSEICIIERLLEKPGPNDAPSLLGAPSGFILEPDIFRSLIKLKPNKKGEYSLIDAIDDYCQSSVVYGRIFKKPFFEVGNKVDMIKTISQIGKFREDLKDLFESQD